MRKQEMEIKPIRTKRDHEAALKEIEGLMDAKRLTLDRRIAFTKC
jgi:hypothetical protein